MFVLFAAQFVLPIFFGNGVRRWITAAFFAWVVAALGQIVVRGCRPKALVSFAETWRAHVRN